MKIEHKVCLSLTPIKGYIHSTNPTLDEVECNQCTELLVDNFIEMIPVDSLMRVLRIFYTKMRRGGILTINGTDINSVANAILSKTMKIPEANKILYGENLRSCISLDDISEILKHVGFKILRKHLNNLNFTVVATRE